MCTAKASFHRTGIKVDKRSLCSLSKLESTSHLNADAYLNPSSFLTTPSRIQSSHPIAHKYGLDNEFEFVIMMPTVLPVAM